MNMAGSTHCCARILPRPCRHCTCTWHQLLFVAAAAQVGGLSTYCHGLLWILRTDVHQHTHSAHILQPHIHGSQKDSHAQTCTLSTHKSFSKIVGQA